MHTLYEMNAPVVVHSLGDGEEYRAIVCGHLRNMIDNVQTGGDVFYIVQMLRPIDPLYPYTHTVISGACLKSA